MRRLLLAFFLFTSAFGLAQTVSVLKDIHTGVNSSGSSPSNFTNVGGTIFFTATDPERGTELWKTDGTTGGTVVVKDINQGSGSSSPSYLTAIGSTVYFAASDGINGTELWKSDGTSAGTTMVKDIYSGSSSSSPQYIIAVGSNLYFSADNGSNGRELWKSDGTLANTAMLTEIYAGSTGSNPVYLTNANGTVYFRATHPSYGTELFKTTGGAPSLVEDIYAGASNNSNPFNLIALNSASSSIIFFSAYTAASGQELWRSDGTLAGTYVVDIYYTFSIFSCGLSLCVDYDYTGSSSPDYFATTGTNIFFAATSSTTGREVYRHDGTTLTLVDDEVAGGDLSPLYLTNANGTIYFSGISGGDRELYKATTSAVTLVSNINAGTDSNPSDFEAVGSTIFFSATHATDGIELYSYNGSSLSYVWNINPGVSSSSPTNKAYLGGLLYLSANHDTYGRELWLYNGSTSLTPLKDINGGTEDGSPAYLFNTGTTIYFQATTSSTGAELWKTDGTTAGTVAVADINAGTSGSGPYPIFGFTNSLIHFGAYTPAKGTEFYVSNGSSGNAVLREINTTTETGSDPGYYGYATLGNDVYFTAYHPTYGYELWKSTNGASATLVTDLYSGTGSSYPQNLTVFGSFVYFTATDDVDGNELFRTSGSGATIIQDLNITAGSNPSNLCVVGSTLFWSADNGADGYELFKTTGTGATMVKTGGINAGTANANPQFMTNVNGTLFFRAIDGGSGAELWKSDGTSAGTVLVKDINASAGSDPSNLTAVGTVLYFTANESTYGTELYKSDGTTIGTVLVKDIFSGASSSSPSRLKNINGTLYFRASTGTGLYLMKTNGTSAGTIVATSGGETYQGVDDINYLGGNVIWAATTNSWGRELLTVKAEPLSQPTGFVVGTRTATSIALSWSLASGSPAGYIVIRNAGSLPTGLPVDGVAPSVNSSLASGTGSVAYVGTATGFTDAGLSSNTTYYYRIYSYNNGGSAVNIYKPHSPLEGNATSLAAEPTSQASAVFTSNVLQNSITFNWTSGNGTERLVLAKQSASTISEMPVDGTAYTANANYASASSLGTAKIVYKGSGTSVNVTGLAAGQAHQFVVFELNGTGTQTNYLTPGAAGSATTLALDGNQPTNLVFSPVGTTSMTLSWTAATAGGTSGYIVTRGTADPSSAPVNMTPYTAGSSSVGGHLVIYNSDNPAVTTCPSTGLTPGTIYYYRVYAKTAATTYVNTNPLTGIQATLQTEPTGAPGTLTLLNPTSSSLSGSFTSGTGATSYIVLHKQNNVVSEVPVDGTTYAVGNLIGGSTVVYVGTITTPPLPFTVTGLMAGTAQYFTAFSAAGSGPATNYRISTSSSAVRTTLFEDPVDQPSNFQFTNLTPTSFDVTFNDAPTIPDGYIVVRRQGAAVATPPTDGTSYSVDDPIGTGVVVHVGSGTSFSESGLTPGVTYHYAAVSYRGSGQATNYLLVNSAVGSQATLAAEPTGQPTALNFSSRTETSLSFSFTAAAGAPAGYLVLRSSGGPPSAVPVDGVEYTAGGLIGSDVVVSAAASTSVVDDNFGDDLVEGTQYYYAVFAYNGTTGTYNYFPTSPLQGNAFTLADEPTDHSINIVFADLATTSMTVSFDQPTIPPAGYLVLRRAGSAPTGTPVDGTGYTAGIALGDGTVAYVGTDPTFSSTGLTPSNTYYYAVYPFNGELTSSNYLTVATSAAPPVPVLTGNRTSLQNEPSAQPTAIAFTSLTTSSFSVGFAASDAARYLILRKEGSAVPTEVPVDGTVYADGSLLGTSTVFTIATAGIPLAQTGLSSATEYSYAIYAFNGIAGANNYRITSPLTGTVSTLATAPTAQPTALSFSVVETENMTVSWTAASPAPGGGYLAVRKAGGSPTGVPVSGTSYTVGSSIGDGTVAYMGTATNFIDFPLDGATDYYYQVFAYNGSGATTNYLTASPASGHQLTFDWEPSFQPTAITFTNVTTSGFTVTITPHPDNFESGHIVIRKNGSAPTAAPADGMTYVVGNGLGDGTIAYVGSATSFPESLAIAPYHYAVFAYIGSGPSINYNQTTPLMGTLTVDATGPTFTNATSGTIGSGLPLTVSYTIADAESGVAGAATLEFRAINSGTATFQTKSMVLTSGKYEAQLNGAEIGEQGVFYRVKATNGHGTQGTSAISTTLVSLTNLQLPPIAAGSVQEDYKIIAVPAILSNNKGDQVFSALGLSNNGENWRMFQFTNGGTTNTEITNLANLQVEPGKGYWLISRNGATINAGAGVTVSVTDTEPFTINLVNGWNLIGNPYLFNLVWADVNAANGTNLTLRTYLNGFVNGTRLDKFEGGFVSAGGSIALKIPTAKNPASGGRENGVEPKMNPLNSEDWEVVINLKNGDYKVPFGGVGMSKDANHSFDYLDAFTLPRLFNYIELNHNKKVYGMTFTKDILPVAENHTWDITVDANMGGVTEMSWDNSYFGTNDRELVLWDEEVQMGIDMREANSYTFAQANRKAFKILFGSREYIESKVELNGLRIHSISPNPSPNDVRVAFSLPGSLPSQVHVRVVNNLGQQIATVFEGTLDAGYHELAWTGNDLRGERPAAGVYLVEIINGEERTSKRLLLK
jgi:ELWxxDGT repeat protein